MTYRKPAPVRPRAFPGFLATISVVLSAGFLVVGGASAEPSLQDKKAEADRVLAQVREIDSQLARAAEAYNLATMQLGEIRSEQAQNGVRLNVARKSLGRAQRLIHERLVAIYTSGETATTLDVLLGAESIEDLLNRFEAVERVSSQDAEVLRQVTAYRVAVKREKEQLAKARAKQERIVAERASHRRAVEAKLSERQALLATIKDQIRQIEARERARQLALAAQARERLASQRLTVGEEAAAQAAAALAEAVGAAPPARHGGVVGIAMRYLGIPYRWGGSSPSTGFDCSGFVMFVYAQVGVSLPHNAAAQFAYGTPVSRAELQPGDVVFFDGLGHNGIYIGGGQFVHSPHTGDVVKISSLDQSWYASRWVGGRRL